MHPSFPPPWPPARQSASDTALVIPRAWLQTLAAQAGVAQGRATPWLAHGRLVLQSAWGQRLALVGPLRQGPPQATPVRARTEDTALAPQADGLCLLLSAPHGAPPPSEPDPAMGWERWLHHHAPDFRLACAHHPSPAVAVLWLRGDGLARAALREHGQWQAFTALHLCGARWTRTPLPWTGACAVPDRPSQRSAPLGPLRRDSRLAAALGLTVLGQLQHSRVAVVGAAGVGSILAHGLARLGVRHVLLIDPNTMAPHHLTGDFPLHCEGRPKVEALARFVRPYLRPGATVDARCLPIASPVAGDLLAETDVVIVCTNHNAARLWANAWALVSHRNLLSITTAQHTDPSTGQRLAVTELLALPAGTGCLACQGGFAHMGARLPHGRSGAGIAASLGLRMVEQLVAGDLSRALHRRLQETPDAGLQVHDGAAHPATPHRACPVCGALSGAGLAAVTPQALRRLAQQVLGTADDQ
jgi:hypothetical protein